MKRIALLVLWLALPVALFAGPPLDDDGTGHRRGNSIGPAPPPSLTRTLIGTDTGGPTAEVENVEQPANELLVVLVAMIYDGNPAGGEGNADNTSGFSLIRLTSSTVDCYRLELWIASPDPSPRSGTINLSGQGSQDISMIVTSWAGLSLGSPRDNGIGDGLASFPTVTTGDVLTQAGDLLVSAVMQIPGAAALGSWNSPTTNGASEATATILTNDCPVVGHTLSEGYRTVASSGAQTASKTSTPTQWLSLIQTFH